MSEGYHELRLTLGWSVLMGSKEVPGNEENKKIVSEPHCPWCKKIECKNVWTSVQRNLGYES